MHEQNSSIYPVLTSGEDSTGAHAAYGAHAPLLSQQVASGVGENMSGNVVCPATSAYQNLSSPPPSNTGVEVTQGQGSDSLTACVDYLSFTFKDHISPSDVQKMLLLREWTNLERGRHGYRSGVCSGHVVVLFDGRPGMGTHVILSGQACRQLEAMGIVTEWQDFIGFLLAHGAHLSRFDVAFDDRAGFIDLDRVESYARAGKVCTHFRKCTTIQSVDLAGHQSKGKTVSFGSRSSATYVRMYDKAAEQQQAEGHWVRVEIEVKDDQAQAVAAEFVQGGIARMAEYLRTVIDFREEGEHSNRSRWPVAEWWAAFLDGASRAPITLSRALRTVAEVRAWVERQVAPSLALLVAVTSSGGLTEINRIIEQGKKRLRLDRYNLIGEVLSYETV